MKRPSALLFACLFTLLGAGPADAIITPRLPVSTSLTTVPGSVSWPDSRNFEYRLDVTAGPAGSEFEFTTPVPRWDLPGIFGSPLVYRSPSLDGPGTLKADFAIVADPAPWGCWRGNFAGTQNWYRVTLEPGAKTTIVAPGLLEAAPLPGMTTETDFRIENGDDPLLIPADVEVGGKPGIRIRSFVVGEEHPNLFAERLPGERFRLRGFTRPALPGRKIRFRAEPVLVHGSPRGRPEATRITTLKTDSKGNFRSGPLSLDSEAIWKITSRLVSYGPYAHESSCGPVVDVTSGD